MRCFKRQHFGFTLVELLLATVIGALVVVVAIATFRSVSQSRTTARYYSDILAHGRYGLNQIRDDLANFYRCRDLQQMRLEGIKGGEAARPRDRLIMYVVSDRPVRHREGESDIYEVEYGLRISKEDQCDYLTRRCAAVIDTEIGNEGGILTMMARYVSCLKFDYFDGRNWQRQWQNQPGLPRMVRISMTLTDEQEQNHAILLSQEVSLEPLPSEWEDEIEIDIETESVTPATAPPK